LRPARREYSEDGALHVGVHYHMQAQRA
jgi:hypothetical protein